MPSGGSDAWASSCSPCILVPRIDTGAERSVWPLLDSRKLRHRAVAVEALADRVQAHQRVPELLVVFHARGARPVLELGVARREDQVRLAFAEQVRLLLEAGSVRLCRPRDARGGFGQPFGHPAELARRQRGLDLFDPGQLRGDRGRRRFDPGEDVERERARRREGGAERGEARDRSPLSELGSSATVARRAADWAAKARKNALKLTISSPSCCSWTFSAAVTLPIAATSLERSCGIGAGDRLVEHRGAAQRRRAVLVGLVERLRPVQAVHVRGPVRRFRRRSACA